MNKIWITLALVCTAGASMAQANKDDIRLQLTLNKADIKSALKILTGKTGIAFVFEPITKPYNLVDLSLPDVTPEDAIKYICTTAGAEATLENGVYIISQPKPKGTGAYGAQVAPKGKRDKTVLSLKLLYCNGKDLLEQLGNSLAYESRNPFRDLAKFSQATGFSTNLPANQAVNNSAAPRSNINQGNIVRNNTESGNDVFQSIEAGGSGPQDFGGQPPAAGGNFGAGQVGGGQVGGGQDPGAIQGAQGAGRASLIPDSIDYLTYDPNTGNLIVRGDPDDIEKLRGYIALFDVAPKQVIVKVEFVSAGTNISKSLGYDVNYQRGSIYVNSNYSRATDPIFFSVGFGNIAARLRAALTEGYGKTINAPIVRTMNNTPATVNSTILSVFFTSILTTGVGGQSVLQSVQQPVSVTSGLTVTPRINPDNTIVMFLNPQVGDYGQIRKSPDGQEIPDRTIQSVATTVRVRSGETVVMGGYTRKQDNNQYNKFPVLSDLPIIGQFFRSTTLDKNDTELLIFVTATIVDDETNTGLTP